MALSSVTSVARSNLIGSRASDPPQALIDARQRQRAAHSPPTAAQIEAGARDKGSTGTERLPAGSLPRVVSQLARSRDAARSMVVAQNADLHVLRYSYTTHKPMEVWISNPPADGKLKLQLVMTPSWHDGSTAQQQQERGEYYARNNEYSVSVKLPGGRREVTSGIKITKAPEYATASGVLEIDLSTKGDIVVEGWPSATFPGGYIEARQFIIHNP